jgi:hypothetical protein
VPVPEYLRTRTRITHARGTRVSATGTDMKQIGYGFKKTRLPAMPVPALPAAGVPDPYPRYPPAKYYIQRNRKLRITSA